MGKQSGGWSVVLDRIQDTEQKPDDTQGKHIRLESELASLSLHVCFDRQLISAITEAALGGTGTEPAYQLLERPISHIERGLLDAVVANLGAEIAAGLSAYFLRDFTVFHPRDEPDAREGISEFVQFRYVVNVFGYSGEFFLTLVSSDLERQFANDSSRDIPVSQDEPRQKLQAELNKSDVMLTVALEPEVFSLQDIANLREGQLLELRSTVTSSVTVWSGSVASFGGTLARQGDRLAVLISSRPT